MNKEEEYFISVGSEIKGSEKSQMFGKSCFKVNGKAFTCFFESEMVFKLSGESHQEALSLEDAKLFDPSGKGRPMKAWVQIPFKHKTYWSKFAEISANLIN